ncbi:hypothetical protein D3C75_973780 [compost metagenome]
MVLSDRRTSSATGFGGDLARYNNLGTNLYFVAILVYTKTKHNAKLVKLLTIPTSSQKREYYKDAGYKA